MKTTANADWRMLETQNLYNQNKQNYHTNNHNNNTFAKHHNVRVTIGVIIYDHTIEH